MIPLLHRWSETVWPQDLAAAVLLVAACVVLVVGLHRRGSSFRRFVPALLLVVLCEVWVLVADLGHRPLSTAWPLGVVVCILLAIQVLAERDGRGGAPEGMPLSASARGYLVVGGILTCLLLGFRLASSPGLLMVWEPSVIWGFGVAFRAGQDVLGFLDTTLLWHEGLVSRGDHSLLYGAPTYAVLLNAGFGVVQLRLVAALLAAASVPAMFAAARRLGGGVATAAALALGLSLPLVFYGRYGTSLSGTLLGVVLATWACWMWLAAPARQWWRGAPAALALIVATLGYSPGRLVVLNLLVVSAMFTVAGCRKGELRRLAGLALLVAILAGFWAFQAHRRTAGSFLNARGEQIVNMMRQPGYLEEYLHRPASPEKVTVRDWLEVAGTLAAQRAPEYLSVLSAPFGRKIGFDQVVLGDPPRLPLLIAPLLPFVLLGFASSLRRLHRPEHLTLLGWLLLSSVPLLLTTRVDAHRLVLLVVPFAVWTALGLIGMIGALDEARIGRWPRHGLGVALIGLVVWLDVVTVFSLKPQRSTLASAMIAEVEGLRGEVVLGSIANSREAGLVDLALLERQRRDPGSAARLVEDDTMRALVDEVEVDPGQISDFVAEIGAGTLLLVPAEEFTQTADALRRSGLEVVELGPEGSRFWRVSRPTASPAS